MRLSSTPAFEALELGRWPARELFGYSVLPVTLEEVIELAELAIEKRVKLILGQLSGPTLVRVQRDSALHRSFLAADLYFADGIGVVLASRILRRPLPERVAGIDVMTRLMERANERGYKVFLFGAHPEVVESVAEVFARDYPGARIVGRQHGYYATSEEPAIARAIAESGADILFVAMTTPKKELFLAKYGDELGVPVLHGVGGSFDVVAGRIKRAPALVQSLALEWAYRIVQEPRRMWRREGLANVLFAGMVAWELAAEVFRPEGAPAKNSGSK